MRTALTASLLLLLACSGESTTAPLRIGLNPWPGYLDLSLAHELGCFERHGLPVQLVEFVSLHDMVRAYELGQIDAMPCTLVEIREANRSRRHAEVIHVFDSSEGPDVILARAGSGPFDPLGRRIAYEPDSLGAYVLQRYLDARGIAFDSIQAVAMDQLEMIEALKDGRVDAVVTYPPASLEIERAGGVNTIFSSAEIPGEILDVMAVDPAMLDRDPTFLERFYAAMQEAEAYAASHPDETVRHKASALRIEPEAWEESIAGLRLYRSADQVQWLWQTDRLERVMRSIDTVLSRLPGEQPSATVDFHCRHRAMPKSLQD